MKKLLFISILFISSFIFSARVFADSISQNTCVKLRGRVVLAEGSDEWHGGKINISCPGGNSVCHQDPSLDRYINRDVEPGEDFDLNACNCANGAEDGVNAACLKVGASPNDCTVEPQGVTNYCEVNVNAINDIVITANCPKAPTCEETGRTETCQGCPAGQSRTYISNSCDEQSHYSECHAAQIAGCEALPTGGPPPTPTLPQLPTATPGPSCDCTYTQQCANGGTQTCSGTTQNGVCKYDQSGVCAPNCSPCTTNPTPTTHTPAPTRAPVCNQDCRNNRSVCDGAWDGCTYCNPSTNKCEVQPGEPTPTPTRVPVCNQDCRNNRSVCDGAWDGCTFCNPSTNKCEVPRGTPTATPTPSATPTPIFNQAACDCDGAERSAIFPGQQTTVTFYGKITGEDRKRGQITAFNVTFGKEDPSNPNQVTPITQATITAQFMEETAEKARYKGTWQIAIPQNLDPNTIYRAYVKKPIICSAKPTAFAPISMTETVLGAETQQAGFFDQILSFISNALSGFFGGNQQTQPAPTPAPRATATPKPTGGAGDNLQLRTLSPATLVPPSDYCTVLRFKK